MLTSPPGPLLNFTHDDYLIASGVGPELAKKTVLCIGMSEAQIDGWVAPHEPAKIVVLTLWEDHIDNRSAKYETIVGDICAMTDIPTGAFDAVLTSALFEHLGNINAACAEITRITKPGSIVAIEMGPVWSSPVGHHLFMDPDEAYLNFTHRKLPSHFHLLYTFEEIRELYTALGKGEFIERILDFIYRLRYVNRFMWEDYVTAFKRHFDPQFKLLFHSDVPADVQQALEAKFAPYKEFATEGGRFIFRTRRAKPWWRLGF